MSVTNGMTELMTVIGDSLKVLIGVNAKNPSIGRVKDRLIKELEKIYEKVPDWIPNEETSALRKVIHDQIAYLKDLGSVIATQEKAMDGGDKPEDWLLSGELLKFNTFRHAHPEVPLSLANNDLSNKNLRDCFLMGVDLSFCNLQNANLEASDLRGTNLKGSNLTGANLKNALIINTNLQNAKMLGANISNSFLNGSNFSGADLMQTDLAGVYLDENTNFKGVVNWRQTKNASGTLKARLEEQGA